MKQLITFLLTLLTSFHVLALGEWTDYSSYSSATKVTLAGDQVFCVTTGGLFAYDKTDYSLQKITSAHNLSDVGIQTVSYGEVADVLLIAYGNSNLDLIFGNDTDPYNISAIKRKQIPADKTIYNILFVDQTAYLSCGFGIVAVNLEKKEIKDTYFIGNNGSYLLVNDMTFDGQYLYAATENGIYKADINSSNLQDFNNWERDEAIPNYSGDFDEIEFFNNEVIVNYNGGDGNDRIYRLANGNWVNFQSGIDNVCEISVASGNLMITCNNVIDIYNSSFSRIAQISSYQFPSYSVDGITPVSTTLDDNNTFWIADNRHALVKVSGNAAESIKPEGPVDNNVFALTSNKGNLWLSSGGRNASWNNMYTNAQFQLFSDNKWKSFNARSVSAMSNLHDIVCIAVDPDNPNHIFAGSWGGGVFEFQDGEFIERYNNQNSSLQTALPESPNDPYVRIGGMDFDSKGNLWVTNSIVGKPLSVFTTDGNWESYEIEDVSSDTDVGQIVVSEDDDQWMVLPRGNDIAVRKEDGTESKQVELIAYFTNGTDQRYTHMRDIYSIAMDLDGAIWFGTSVGVSVAYDPEDVWNDETFYVSQPSLDEGDGLYHPLLSSETVTAIAVDGANRKWLGTKNSGVYLISENGEEELEHFTSANSPLYSNEITSIAINGENGEVFFGTPKGLISYQGEAISGNNVYTDVYAYPNPVREDYEGDIVIKGLIQDTDIKITDISGNLVYETTSLGGQAVWDGTNLFGNRVSTGVYVVFGNDRYGNQTFTTKILVIH